MQISQTAQVQQKKNLIYENIVQAEYDVQQFADYLTSQPPNYTSNLTQISLSSLKKFIDKFIQKQKIPNYNQIEVNKVQSSKNISLDNNNVHLNMINNIDNHKQDKQQYYVKSIDCLKEVNIFGMNQIQVNIVSFKKNQGKFLKRDFIMYKLDLPQLHKQLERRYSDFQWIKKLLGYYHPGIVIPPLPRKKMKKIFTSEHVKKKGRMLECFLRKCLQIPDLRSDEHFYRFLTTDQYSKFQQYKKQNQIDKNVISIDKIKTQSGLVQYGITQQLLSLNQKGLKYFTQISPIVKDIYKQIKRIKQNIKSCALNFQNLQSLSKKISSVDQQFKLFSQKQQNNFFQYLNVLSNNYKQQMKIMSELWQKQIYIKLKYQYHHSEMFEIQIKQYKIHEKQFYTKKQEIMKKKMKIYSKSISDWHLTPQLKNKFQKSKPTFQQVSPYLMEKKSQQMNKLQLKFALFTKQLANSIEFYQRNNNSHGLKIFQIFVLKQYECQRKWQRQLRQLISKQFNMKKILMDDSIFQNNQRNSIRLKENQKQVQTSKQLKNIEILNEQKNNSNGQRNSIKGFFNQFRRQK